MAQATLVDSHIEDGERLIGEMCRQGMETTPEVKPGFWAKESETGHWFFYLITPLAGENGTVREAFRAISPLVDEMWKNGSLIDPFDFRVISPKDPGIKSILDHRGGFMSNGFGHLDVIEAYVYPSIDEILDGLRDAAISSCFALKKKPSPFGMQLNGPRQVDRPGALSQLWLALDRLKKRFGIKGSCLEERMANLETVRGLDWRKKPIEDVARAFELTRENPTCRDADAFDLLKSAIQTLGEHLPPSYASERLMPELVRAVSAEDRGLAVIVG